MARLRMRQTRFHKGDPASPKTFSRASLKRFQGVWGRKAKAMHTKYAHLKSCRRHPSEGSREACLRLRLHFIEGDAGRQLDQLRGAVLLVDIEHRKIGDE